MALHRFLGVSIVATASACGCQIRGPAGPSDTDGCQSAGESAPGGNLRTLAADLREAIAEEPASYQRLLWRASKIARKACVGRAWPAVERALERQDLMLCGRWEQIQFRLDSYLYLVEGKAYRTSGGCDLDLLLDIDVLITGSKTEAARTEVTVARAVLRAQPNAPYERVVREAAFPQGSVLQRALECEEVREAALRYPFVQEIEVAYDRIADHNRATVPSGFWGSIEFADATQDPSAGTRLSFTAESGLDPVESWDGRAVPEAFTSQDIVRDIEFGGANSWSKSTDHGSVERAERDRAADECWWGWNPGPLRGIPDSGRGDVHGAGDLLSLPADIASLEVKDEKLSDEDLRALSRFRKLKALDLNLCRDFGDEGIAHIARMTGLTALSIGGEKITDAGIAKLEALSRLNYLSLGSVRFTDVGFEAIGRLSELVHLSLYGCEGLTYAGMASLSRLERLRYLHLSSCEQISDQGFERLSSIGSLDTLSLSRMQLVSAGGLAHLRKLSGLRRLWIEGSPTDDDGLARIGECEGLEEIVLQDLPNITDDGLLGLTSLRRLMRLGIWGCEQITLAGARELASALPGRYEVR